MPPNRFPNFDFPRHRSPLMPTIPRWVVRRGVGVLRDPSLLRERRRMPPRDRIDKPPKLLAHGPWRIAPVRCGDRADELLKSLLTCDLLVLRIAPIEFMFELGRNCRQKFQLLNIHLGIDSASLRCMKTSSFNSKSCTAARRRLR